DNKKTIFVSEIKEGQQLQDLFLVSRKNLAETKTGKPYLALTLMDKSGEIEGRIWDDAARFEPEADVGQIVAVDAQAKAFREQLQLNITHLQPVEEGAVPLGCFMPASKRSTREMKSELTQLIDTVDDPELHRLLSLIFQGRFFKQFCLAPAAKMMHHAYLGGLLEHTLSVTGLALQITRHYPLLDRNLLVTGCLLHDIGKVREFSFSTVPFDYTDSGRLIGHLVLGCEMVRNKAESIPDLPPERLDQLLHLILSHHGRHEFGSPSLPMTIEAILLHHLDDMDAKVNYIDRLSEQVDPGQYQWSDYQRPLDRFLLLRGPQENSLKTPVPGKRGHEPHKQDRETQANRDNSDQSKRQPTLF
ncbi:MAG: 3'-5' exoribonuclease YhaM family protein, partial [Desulfobulbales bacterium]